MNAQALDELRWKKRVVIIYGPAGPDKKVGQQLELFRAQHAGVLERDMAEIAIRKTSDHREIVKRFNLREFTVLLIGKDGGEKFRSTRIVQPETLFRLIDSMPMRQQESHNPARI